MKALSSGLARVIAVRLLGLDPRDPHRQNFDDINITFISEHFLNRTIFIVFFGSLSKLIRMQTYRQGGGIFPNRELSSVQFNSVALHEHASVFNVLIILLKKLVNFN